MSDIKRLTPPQSRKVNALVRRTCCNYDSGNCILLDDGDECVCPQLISYSLLCKWFRIAVLPADKELYAELYHAEDMRRLRIGKAKRELLEKFDIVEAGAYRNSMNKFNEHGSTSTVEYIALRRAELQAEYEKHKRQVEIMLEQRKRKCL